MGKNILCFTLIIMLYACQDENSTLGDGYVQTSFRNVFTDTCTVSFSTIFADSLDTRGDSIFQIGYVKDETWGEILSAYYAEFSMASISVDKESKYELDSVVLVMRYSGHYFGDTLATQRIGVHRLSSFIKLVDDETLYNQTVTQVEEEPLFTFVIKPLPTSKKKIEVRMPDSFGRKLLADMVAELEDFDDQDKFKAYFPGLALIPERNESCISGFSVNDSTMMIRLCYHESGGSREERTLDLKVNTDRAYTFVDHNRDNSPLEIIKSGRNNAVAASLLSQRAYLQGLTGFYNGIDFPHLNNLQMEGDVVSIESATLYLYPVVGSYGKTNQLPQTLRLFVTDENHIVQDAIYDSSGSTVQSGNLTMDEASKLDTYYSFDISSFIRDNLGTWGTTRQKLLLTMEDADYLTSFSQVIFECDASKDNRYVRLDLRYKIYNK